MDEKPPYTLPPDFPPAWAGGWGEDTHGVFARLVLGGASFEMRWIPPGTFKMGSPAGEVGRFPDEQIHLVSMSLGYWLSATPCTQAQWEAVMRGNPSKFKGAHRPVESVDWNQVKEFAVKVTEMARQAKALPEGFEFRLPTEAEWEYACRAGTGSAFNDGSACTVPDGKDPGLAKLGWHGEGEKGETHPVGELMPNGWGLYDIHGNVWEWCEDRAEWKDEVVTDTYVDGVTDPLCRQGARRVIRGGSSWNFARFCRSACRSADNPEDRYNNVGFRLAAGQELKTSESGATGPEAGGADAPG